MTGESAAKAAAGARSKMSLQEAQMILDVQANAPWEDVVKARALNTARATRRYRARCVMRVAPP